MKPATVDRMETDGSYRQELDAWHKAIDHIPPPRQIYRCPWPRCLHLYHQRADLHVHIDVIHKGNTP